jgi:lipopolysaccharide export LptBFGC system permease protein LptF
MKRRLTPLFAVLMLILGLSIAPASARAKSDCTAMAFPLILGIGY